MSARSSKSLNSLFTGPSNTSNWDCKDEVTDINMASNALIYKRALAIQLTPFSLLPSLSLSLSLASLPYLNSNGNPSFDDFKRSCKSKMNRL